MDFETNKFLEEHTGTGTGTGKGTGNGTGNLQRSLILKTNFKDLILVNSNYALTTPKNL